MILISDPLTGVGMRKVILRLSTLILLVTVSSPHVSAQENPDTTWIEIEGTVVDWISGAGLPRAQGYAPPDREKVRVQDD
jgi:hypothetical protein